VNTDVREIRYLVYHDPRAFKFMFKNPQEDKRRLSAIIGRMIPYRIGIEFELFGSLVNLSGINKTDRKPNVRKKLSYEKSVNKAMIKRFNLVDYSEDNYNWKEKDELDGCLNEIRVSFKGTHQLNSLWNICKALNENCKIPSEKGGIHIHIDITELIEKYPNAKEYVGNYFSMKSQLSRIANIFGGYKGTYNKRGCKIENKGYWVNISHKNSVEFRIGALNFNYQTIIRWIISLSKMVTEVKTNLYNNVPNQKPNQNIKSEFSRLEQISLPWDNLTDCNMNTYYSQHNGTTIRIEGTNNSPASRYTLWV